MKKASLWTLVLVGITTLFFYTNCGVKADRSHLANSSFYFKDMTEMVVDVLYEDETPGEPGDVGAKPFIANGTGTYHYWDILEANLAELFKNRPITLVIPKTLAEMNSIPDQNKSVWTLEEALSLVSQYQVNPTHATQARFTILFVNGYAANEDGTPNPSTLGFQISGTPVVIIFKDVIRSTGVRANGFVPKYVEQSTIVHELGHALGLVNNGLPLTSDHQDSAHGAHCSNPTCVMYYLNEGKDNLIQFVSQFSDTQTPILFEPACLQDAHSL